VPDDKRRLETGATDDFRATDAREEIDEGLDKGVGVEVETRGLVNGGPMDPSDFNDVRGPTLVLTRVLLPSVDILIAEDVKVESEGSFR